MGIQLEAPVAAKNNGQNDVTKPREQTPPLPAEPQQESDGNMEISSESDVENGSDKRPKKKKRKKEKNSKNRKVNIEYARHPTF